MYEMKYPNLFKPIVIGGTLFRNRIFASPTGYQNVTGDDILPPGAEAYYERKAMGGCASVCTCELIVDEELGRGGMNHTCIENPRAFNPLCRIAHAISSQGAVPTAELQHTGMYANRELAVFGGSSLGKAYGPVECELDGRKIEAMDEAMIQRTIEKYAKAAATAKRAGFGMILIHAGHGWLLQQFLSPTLNTRTDKWGGPSIENRARLTVAVCDAVREAVGPNFPIEVRMSGSECYEGGYGIEEGIAFAKQLEGHCDLIHVSAGSHEVREVFGVTHPSMFLGESPNVRFAAEIKKHVSTPVATVGAMGNEPWELEEIIASGKADIIEMARSLLADPDLPIKLRTGREDEIRPCLRCLSCFSSEITCGEPYCAVNPETGREFDVKWAAPEAITKKKVLIIGGGVGGMEAALTCHARGHKVILCEKNGRLGGGIRCEERVPFKKYIDVYLNRQAAKIEKAGIDVRLNTAVTPEYAASLEPDVIIAALGSVTIKPPIPGIDGANVLAAEYAYTHEDEVGENVVVLGAGMVGIEFAIYMAMLGRKVKIVEMADRMNDGGNFLLGSCQEVELQKQGIALHLNTKAVEISEKGVLCETRDGEKPFFEADSVIYAVGQRPLQNEALTFANIAPEFHILGDCVKQANIAAATNAAFTIARNIGRF